MIVRVWIIAGAAFIVVAWFLTVPFSPRPYQGSATSHIEAYRADGLMPESALIMSRSIGHEIFEVPAEDADHAQMQGMTMPAGEEHAGMPGMTMPADQGHDAMSGMESQSEPGQAHDQMPGMTSPQHEQGEHSAMPGTQMPMGTEQAHDQMPGMATPQHDQAGHGNMPEMTTPQQAHGGHGDTPEMQMPIATEQAHDQMPGMSASEQGHGGHGAGGGLTVLMAHGREAARAREIRVQMSEWGFAPARVDVKPGEVVRLVVRNAGNNPHEFMLMSHAAMAAVNYRLQRADWNLLEHEAIYERGIVMPGDAIEVTLRVDQPGAWMFMCMFPYHMQFGMMGTMATEGQGMDMGGMHM